MGRVAVFQIPEDQMKTAYRTAACVAVEDQHYPIQRETGLVFAHERHVPHLVAHGLRHLESGQDFPKGYEPAKPGDAKAQKRMLDAVPSVVEDESGWRERFAAAERGEAAGEPGDKK